MKRIKQGLRINEIIAEAIELFNLSTLEDYYLDSNSRIRARGFIYDEDTGVFINELGLLEYDSPMIEVGRERVREMLNFRAKQSLLIDWVEESEFKLEKEAVA